MEILKKEKSEVLIDQRSGSEQPRVEEKGHPAFKGKIERVLELSGFRRRNTLLGLDIGSSGIKFAEVNKTKKGWRLVNAGIVDLSSEVFSKVDTPGKLALDIRNALRKFKVTTNRAAISISGDDFIQRPIRVPRMPKKELEQVLIWEIKKYTDLPSDQLCMDYIVNPKQDESTDNLDVFLVSAPKRRIEERISLIHSAGLKCAVLETKAIALTGAVLELAPEFCRKTFAVLDIGCKTSVLNIVRDGFLSFTREIESGGENLTLALCNKLKYEHKKAETQKREVGLLSEVREDGPDSAEESLDVAKTLEQETDNLVQEIRKSFEYYRAQFPEDEVGELLLTGGGSGLPGLQKFLSQRLEMDVRLFDPLDSLLSVENPEARKYMQQICGRLSVALGLGTWRR